MTKEEIKQALTSDPDTYHIETMAKGWEYKVTYYKSSTGGKSFDISDIIHSILAPAIKDWDVGAQTFVVSKQKHIDSTVKADAESTSMEDLEAAEKIHDRQFKVLEPPAEEVLGDRKPFTVSLEYLENRPHEFMAALIESFDLPSNTTIVSFLANLDGFETDAEQPTWSVDLYLDSQIGKKFVVNLVDDGTLDTVIEIGGREFRFDQEFASSCRNKEGAMTIRGLRYLGYNILNSLEEEELEKIHEKETG